MATRSVVTRCVCGGGRGGGRVRGGHVRVVCIQTKVEYKLDHAIYSMHV